MIAPIIICRHKSGVRHEWTRHEWSQESRVPAAEVLGSMWLVGRPIQQTSVPPYSVQHLHCSRSSAAVAAAVLLHCSRPSPSPTKHTAAPHSLPEHSPALALTSSLLSSIAIVVAVLLRVSKACLLTAYVKCLKVFFSFPRHSSQNNIQNVCT